MRRNDVIFNLARSGILLKFCVSKRRASTGGGAPLEPFSITHFDYKQVAPPEL